MPGPPPRAAAIVTWAAGLILLVLLVATWTVRVPYPYDLEWMEGGMLAHAWRMRQELPVYSEPSAEWAPFIYPPGYSAIVAGLASFVPLHPALGRVVSLAGVALACLSLLLVLRRRGAPQSLALGLVACFLGTYPATGAFLDLVRPDGVYVGLVGLSVALALDGRRGTPVASGLVLAAAFLVKQNAAVFGAPLLLGLCLRSWRQGAAFAAASVGPALLLLGYLQWRTAGRFLVYLVDIPASHPSIWLRFWPGTVQELGTALGVLVPAGGLWLVWDLAKRSWIPVPLATVFPVGCGMVSVALSNLVPLTVGVGVVPQLAGLSAFGFGVVVGWTALRAADLPRRLVTAEDVLVFGVLLTSLLLAGVMRAHVGGYVNVHLTLYWATTLAFGWTMARAGGPVRWAVPVQLVVSIAVLMTWKLQPTEQARAAGDQLVEALREGEGPVLSPFAAWLPTYAGHRPSVHYMALWDLDYEGGPYRDRLDGVRAAVRARRWPQAVQATYAFPFGLDAAYERRGDLDVGDLLRPATGFDAAPKAVMVPKGK